MGEFVVQDGSGIRWEPVRWQMMIGRGWDNDLRLRSGLASRRHAWVWHNGDQVVIEDLGSTHGTFVNGQLLRAPLLLHHNDVIAMGDARLTYLAQRDTCVRPGPLPPGGQSWRNGDGTPPMGFQYLMVSQTFCAQCSTANHPASVYCVRCGHPLPGTAPAGSEWREEQQQVRPVQRTTPTEPIVARPFPQTRSGSAGGPSNERGIWALAIIMAILTVILLMTLGVLLVFALA